MTNDANVNEKNDVTEQIFNQTYIWNDKPLQIKEVIKIIQTEHSEHTLIEWNDMFGNFMKRLRKEKIGYTSLPEPDRTNFYLSAKIHSFVQELNNLLMQYLEDENSNSTYEKCEKPEFIAAKDALTQNLPKLHKMVIDKKRNTIETFFKIPAIKLYFKSFVFNLKNKHSGDENMSLAQKIHFPTKYYSDSRGSAYFRFGDVLENSLEKIRTDENGNIVNAAEVVRLIFTEPFTHTCFLCNSPNFLHFNHESGFVEEVYDDDICKVYKKKFDHDFLHTEITTTGKLIFLNDVRILNENRDLFDEISDFGYENKIHTDANTWIGQNGFMKICSHLFNVGNLQKVK